MTEILKSDEGRDWRDRGACRYVDPELFYPERRHGRPRRQEAERAIAVCQHCPVLRECFRWALESGEQWAVAGGFDFGSAAARSALERRAS